MWLIHLVDRVVMAGAGVVSLLALGWGVFKAGVDKEKMSNPAYAAVVILMAVGLCDLWWGWVCLRFR